MATAWICMVPFVPSRHEMGGGQCLDQVFDGVQWYRARRAWLPRPAGDGCLDGGRRMHIVGHTAPTRALHRTDGGQMMLVESAHKGGVVSIARIDYDLLDGHAPQTRPIQQSQRDSGCAGSPPPGYVPACDASHPGSSTRTHRCALTLKNRWRSSRRSATLFSGGYKFRFCVRESTVGYSLVSLLYPYVGFSLTILSTPQYTQ
jgi:hypothetical protein